MPTEAEQKFNEAMLDIYRRAKAEAGYNATRFLGIVVERGGLETARDRVHAATGRVAVRVPAHALPRALARIAGHPITATSANLAGEPPATTVTELSRTLAGRIDLVLDGGPTIGGLPSTIVDVTGNTPTLIRAGVVAWARVLEFVKCPPSTDV